MPEIIRTANETLRSRPRRGGFLASLSASLLTSLAAPAHAGIGPAVAEPLHLILGAFDRQQTATLTLTFGLACFAVLTTVALIRARRHIGRIENVSRDDAVSCRPRSIG